MVNAVLAVCPSLFSRRVTLSKLSDHLVMISPRYYFIVVGTTPSSGKGGISIALRGLLEGMKAESIPHVFIATHDPGAMFRQFFPFIRAIPKILGALIRSRLFGGKVYLFLHPGPSFSLVRKFLIAAIGRLFGGVVISQTHSYQVVDYFKHPLWRVFLRVYFKAVDHIFVMTPWWERKFLAERIGKGKVSVVPNAIEPSLGKYLATSPACPSDSKLRDVTIFSMARFVDGKGVEILLRALEFLPDNYRLTLAGDGPRRSSYEELVASVGVGQRVTFEGWVDERRKAELFSAATLFCLPSRNDSFGMVYVEAMTHGVPIVALDHGPVADVVPDGVVGVLAREETPQAIARAIVSLAEDPALCDKGLACQAWVRKNYMPDVVVGKILDALRIS